MRAIVYSTLMLSLATVGFADFRYITTTKSAGPGGDTVSKHFVKGNKMKVDSADNVIISDFDSQTLTMVNHTTKTYRVAPLAQATAAIEQSGLEVKADVKDTGLQKRIAGFNCKQIIMTMTMGGQATPGAPPMNMNMENEMWLSTEVPGASELKAITARMIERGIVSGGGNPQMTRMMADMQKQLAKVGGGVTVLQITRVKAGDTAQTKQVQAQIQAMKTQMEAIKKKGGPQAEAMEKALSAMGGASGGKYLMEMTTESSGFSTEFIPASEFAIPAGYKKADR